MARQTIINAHGINDALDELVSLQPKVIESMTSEEFEEVTEAGLRRAFLFAKELSSVLKKASDTEVSFNAISQAQRHIRGISSEINSYYADKNVAHLNTAISNLDAAVAAAKSGIMNWSPQTPAAYDDLLNSVQQTATTTIKSLKGQHANLSRKVEETEADLAAIKEQAAASKAATELSAKTVEQSIAEIKTEFAQLKGAFNEEIRSFVDDFTKKVDQLLQQYESAASESVNKAKSFEAQAKRIVQIVGNIGVTGNYQNRAKNERDQANYLRYGAIAFFVVGTVILAASVRASFVGQFDAIHLVARALVALTISAPAFYLAKELARHRSNADQAKQT